MMQNGWDLTLRVGCRLPDWRWNTSTNFELTCVPQGSCLEPILFNLWTANFPNCLHSSTNHNVIRWLSAAFVVWARAHEDSHWSKINCDLEQVSMWSVISGLKLNVNNYTIMYSAPSVTLCSPSVTVLWWSSCMTWSWQCRTRSRRLVWWWTMTSHLLTMSLMLPKELWGGLGVYAGLEVFIQNLQIFG